MAKFIGNQLGHFREVEFDTGGQLWGSSIWIRVGLDFNKLLHRVLKLLMAMGTKSLISFTYELYRFSTIGVDAWDTLSSYASVNWILDSMKNWTPSHLAHGFVYHHLRSCDLE
ncbi:hypothetical protein Salat_1892600, partial [Sesamum alatum]